MSTIDKILNLQDEITTLKQELVKDYKENIKKVLFSALSTDEWVVQSYTRLEIFLCDCSELKIYTQFFTEEEIEKMVKTCITCLCEKSKELYWVWFKDYRELTEEELIEWKNELKKFGSKFYIKNIKPLLDIDDDGYIQARTEIYYKKGDFPVLVNKWKIRDGIQCP